MPEMNAQISVSLFYVVLLALMNIVLSIYVARRRVQTKIGIGDGGNESMLQAIRVHGNFNEYVPLALVLLLAVDLAGASAWILHVMGGTLLVGRLLHAQGLNSSSGRSMGRGVGTTLTFVCYLVGIIAAVYLLIN